MFTQNELSDAQVTFPPAAIGMEIAGKGLVVLFKQLHTLQQQCGEKEFIPDTCDDHPTPDVAQDDSQTEPSQDELVTETESDTIEIDHGGNGREYNHENVYVHPKRTRTIIIKLPVRLTTVKEDARDELSQSGGYVTMCTLIRQTIVTGTDCYKQILEYDVMYCIVINSSVLRTSTVRKRSSAGINIHGRSEGHCVFIRLVFFLTSNHQVSTLVLEK